LFELMRQHGEFQEAVVGERLDHTHRLLPPTCTSVPTAGRAALPCRLSGGERIRMRTHICPLSMTRVCAAPRLSLRLPTALRGASIMSLTAPVLWRAYDRGTRATPLVSESALPGPRPDARCGLPRTVVPQWIGHETARRRLDWSVEMAETY